MRASDVRRLFRMGARVAAGKVVRRLRRRVGARAERWRVRTRGTRLDVSGVRLRRRLSPLEADVLALLSEEEVADVAEYHLAHRFDLLGSGWIRVVHGMSCPGLEGHRYDPPPPLVADADGRWLGGRVHSRNLPAARLAWRLVDPGYVPIDWHIDFRSGYRWDERTLGADVPYGHLPGVDVKVPWELARMQHLAQLALAHALGASGREGFQAPEVYAREVRNQILDFVAQNPPGVGVNWSCTMDVAIRAVNILVAWDLLEAHGAIPDEDFLDELGRSVLEHGTHIAGNLEWDPVLRANHYLADIVGLVFCAAYLPRGPEADAWLAFGVRELVAEVEAQFHPEGTNFEASTAYHRLSSELALYATALVCGLGEGELEALETYDPALAPTPPGLGPPPVELHAVGGRRTPFPPWFLERLERAAGFTVHATKPDGRVVQIGDNDSGRLLKLRPVRRAMHVREARDLYANLEGYAELPDEETYWDEDHLRHGHLLSAMGGLIDRPDLVALSGDGGFEAELVRSVAGGVPFPSFDVEVATVVEGAELPGWLADRDPDREVVYEVGSGKGTEGLETFAYPAFGLYVLRSEAVFVAVRCGPVGQRGNGGHAHNDQLAVSVSIDGCERAVDPGTYLYTPLPEVRNAYRSVRAHDAPQVEGREPGRMDLGLFTLADRADAECLRFDPDGFWGRHHGFGPALYRRVRVDPDAVRVADWTEGDLRLVAPRRDLPVSEGYGIVLRRRRGAERG